MLLHLSPSSRMSPAEQIARQVQARIASGAMPPGTWLPAITALARNNRIGRSTIERALEQLSRTGVLLRESGARFRIAPRPHHRPDRRFGTAKKRGSLPGRESALAAGIQHALQSPALPPHADLTFAAASESLDPVGGDFYEIQPLGDRKYFIAIGDVCGHGVPAALLRFQVQAILKTRTRDMPCPAKLSVQLNRYLRAYAAGTQFMTLFLAVYDANDASLTSVNAGHQPPVVLHADGRIEQSGLASPALGLIDKPEFAVSRTQFPDQSKLACVTDGVLEAPDEAGRFLGEAGLRRLVAKAGELDCEAACSLIVEAVRSRKCIDDWTVLVAQARIPIEADSRRAAADATLSPKDWKPQ